MSTRAQTARLKEKFIESFAFMGNITRACEEAGVSRRVVYTWLEKDEQFSLAYNEANAISTERLEAEAWRRAHDGTEEPVYQSGVRIGTIKKYSDTLLIFLLKARNPAKYRDQPPRDFNLNVNTRTMAQREADFDYDGFAADFAALFSGSLLPGDDPEEGASESVDSAHAD